jgi:hypothetical protein
MKEIKRARDELRQEIDWNGLFDTTTLYVGNILHILGILSFKTIYVYYLGLCQTYAS